MNGADQEEPAELKPTESSIGTHSCGFFEFGRSFGVTEGM
jgi:hypothetical protein